jgi:hypothetical protein
MAIVQALLAAVTRSAGTHRCPPRPISALSPSPWGQLNLWRVGHAVPVAVLTHSLYEGGEIADRRRTNRATTRDYVQPWDSPRMLEWL